MDFPLCPFCHHSLPTSRGLASGSGHIRKALANVQGGVSGPTYAQFDLQQVRLCTTVGGEHPNFHGASGPNQGKRWWLHPLGAHFLTEGKTPKGCPVKDSTGNSLFSSPDPGEADSDWYSMESEVPSTHHRWDEKCLAPMHLDMLIFKSMDPNMDVTYTLWRFNVQGW